MARTAAALVIGNEVLTGKTAERNVHVLASTLFELGVALRRVVVCPDEVAVIARDVSALAGAHDFVFTSGGVGPTHDDVTLDAIALATGRPLEQEPTLEALLRGHFGDRCTVTHLRMARVPRGTVLVAGADSPWPTFVVDNIHVLPGVPEIFERKLEALRPRLAQPTRFVTRAVFTRPDEPEIAAVLAELAARHPSVAIGSYPRWRGEDYRVKVTFDGSRPEDVTRAVEALVAALDPRDIVRVE